jgi:UDP-N-acetylglucosamine:LPS N-acetylglucosamine transferase
MHHKARILLTLHCPEKYEEEKAARTAFEEQLKSIGVQGGAQGDKDLVNTIPKPPGTAGKDYSVQIEMGLAGTVKKSEKYKAIQVCHTPDI